MWHVWLAGTLSICTPIVLCSFNSGLCSARPNVSSTPIHHRANTVVNLLCFFRYCLRTLHSGGSGCYKRGCCRSGLQWPSNHRNPPPAVPGSETSVYPIARNAVVFCTPKGGKNADDVAGLVGTTILRIFGFPAPEIRFLAL